MKRIFERFVIDKCEGAKERVYDIQISKMLQKETKRMKNIRKIGRRSHFLEITVSYNITGYNSCCVTVR